MSLLPASCACPSASESQNNQGDNHQPIPGLVIVFYMSVLARLRGESPLKVQITASKIQGEATRLVWNTNNIPKAWREIYSKPMIRITMRLKRHIRRANKIKCTDKGLVAKRKNLINEALNDLEDMYDIIDSIADTLPMKWDRFDSLLDLMIYEDEKLRNWRDTTTLIKK